MIAGAVTINDAFAQTNTERLSTVVDTTSDTNSKVAQLTEIWNNFGSQFTPITDALNMVAAEITTISGEISDLSDDVMATSAKVDTLEDKLDNYAATRASDSAELKEQIESLSEALPDIQNKISTLAGDASVGDLADKVDSITTQLNEFSGTLATIQTEVESIQGELGIVKETAQTVVGSAPEQLFHCDDKCEYEVKLAWYAHGLDEADVDEEYKTKYHFTCESDVFIGTVTSDIGEGTAADDNSGTDRITFEYNSAESIGEVNNPVYYVTDDANRADATLSVGGNVLFDSTFTGTEAPPTPGIIFNSEHDFELMELKAGELLTFESTTQAQGSTNAAVNGTALYKYANTDMNTDYATDIAISPAGALSNDRTGQFATKAQLGAATVYTVTVNYHSEAADPECRITPADVAPLDNVDQILFISPTIDDDDGVLTTYEAEVDCDLNAVRITDVTADLTGADGFNNYVNMKLTVGDDTEAEFTFADNTSILNEKYSYPIEFEATNLKIEGDAFVGSGLVIQVTYDTVTGGECTSQ
jgi:predicted  nucleic acid-binding Zn-ribbon protein